MSGSAGQRWDGVRLHVVTGKGGTGKTTVAAALALALATRGRRVLLVEVEGRQGIAQLFDSPPLPYEERRIATGLGGEGDGGEGDGGEVLALAIDAEAALLEYLELFYKLGRAGKVLRAVGAIDFVTTVAPGLRDVLLTGKAFEAVRRRGKGSRNVYDAVVMDAPPTGRIARFLNVNAEVAGLAKTGPIRGQADSIVDLLRSPETAVHLVTLLEEMPVQETCDAVEELNSAKLPLGAVIVNAVRQPLLLDAERDAAESGRLSRSAVVAGLGRAGLDTSEATVSALLQEAREHAERVRLEDDQRARLDALDRPAYALPLLADGVDLGGLYYLAELLSRRPVWP